MRTDHDDSRRSTRQIGSPGEQTEPHTALTPGHPPSVEDMDVNGEEELERLVLLLRQNPGQARAMAAAMAAYQTTGQDQSQTLRPRVETPASSPLPGPHRQDRGTVESTASKTKKREIVHPSLFDGDRTNWITFRNKMTMKLHVDEDLYATERQRIVYWLSRLDPALRKQLEPTFDDYGLPEFKAEKELIDLLNTLYLNHGQLEEDQAAYERLRMKHDDEFMPFFLNFKRLASITGYDATFELFQRELSRRLPMRLREARVYANVKLADTNALTEYYTRVDSFFRQNQAALQRKLSRIP